jgi:hypothetical protein
MLKGNNFLVDKEIIFVFELFTTFAVPINMFFLHIAGVARAFKVV